jgi:hypothetical protein
MSKKSVLARAFRGELVPTEAELARVEGRDYEPASVLLEQVQEEHERRPPAGRRRVQTAPSAAPVSTTADATKALTRTHICEKRIAPSGVEDDGRPQQRILKCRCLSRPSTM